MKKDHSRYLFALWVALAFAMAGLSALCFVFLEGKSFDPSSGVSVFRSARDPSYGLITVLGALINFLLFSAYFMDPEGKLMPRLNVPGKEFWLVTPDRRAIFAVRLRRIVSALGAYIDFLISSTFYMTLHYFYPSAIPCPRHLLMILIWMALTVLLGFYAVAQFRRPKSVSTA